MTNREPKTITKRSPGKGLWEQIQVNGDMKYAFYYPADANHKTERVEYDHFHPGELTEEYAVTFKPLDVCPWPLAGEPTEPDPELWSRIKAFIMNHGELNDDRLYDVHTAWVYASWIPEIFQTFPYLWYFGPKNSGKTRMLEILKALCYRGFLSPSITDAGLYRIIDEWKPTLLLDEAEIYNKEERTTIQHLLNAGYKRGQIIPRMLGTDGGGYTFELFDPFGPKALSSTRGFRDTLESRSIPVSMEKNSAPVNLYIDEAEAKAIRSQLLMWRFRRLADIIDVSYVLDVLQNTPPPELSYANGRFLELYTPLVTIANEGKEDILSYAKDQWSLTIDEEKQTEEAHITQILIEYAPNVEKGFIPTSVITENYNNGLSESESLDNRRAGWIMKRLGFVAKSNGKQRGWRYDARRVERLAVRYKAPLPARTSKTSKTSSMDLDDYAAFDARRQESFNQMTREATA